MRKILLLLSCFMLANISFAQDFSNKGKDFWLGYGYHVRFLTGGSGGSNSQNMVLYFATENIPGTLTNIKIEIPSVGYVENIINVAPGTIVTSQPIPKSGSQDARLTSEGQYSQGIHVTSSRPVVAYTHIYDGNVSGATLLFPTNTLGKEYYSVNYTQVSNENFSNSFFFVVATDTGSTTVEITPSGTTQTHVAGVPFTVTLNQGEIYNVMGQINGTGGGGNWLGVDLTGSKIKSVSVNGSSCKRIAVFSGAGKMRINCGNGTRNSSDNLIAQAFPKNAWGKRFLTAPTQNMPYNYFRVCVTAPETIVKLNGVIQTGLINNFYYDFPLSNVPQLIEADQPVMVAQYITTANACGNTAIGGTGDPDMIYLSPVEQTIDQVILNSTPNFAITQHWINVVIKTTAVSSFNITGALSPPVFIPHPQDPTYSYAQISVSAGSHTLRADSGFNAIAYGYGGAESYAYNAGTNLKDLYNFIIPLNPLNISGTNSACACTPFFYTVTYPFQPISLFWDFKGFQTPNVSVSSPVADSTFLINGKQVWQYRLPTSYTYCPAGNYPVSITAGTAGSDGCGNLQTKDDTLFVRNTPVTDFNWTSTGCYTDSVYFSDQSSYDPGTFSYQWTWDFGDGNTSNLRNPTHKYADPGSYTVKFSLVSNIGCISATTSRPVTVTFKPIAKFGFLNPLCEGKAITIKDSSQVFAPGTLKTWIWDYGDGQKDTLVNNTNLSHVYSAWGPKTASLQVITTSGCVGDLFTKDFTVHPNPIARFTMPAAVCLPYQQAQFTDASTIADGTQGTFSWKWKFGEPVSGIRDSSILQSPTHLYGSSGPFNVSLMVTSAAGCIDDSVRIFSAIYPKPMAAFTVNPESCFTVATALSSTSDGQGSAISNWYWNYGDASLEGSGQTTSHIYPLADTFFIKHWIKTDKGCLSDTAIQSTIVNPLPVAGFTISTPACETRGITFTNTSSTSTGNITKWTWNFANGRPDSIINSSAPFPFIYNTAGSYPVKLIVETNKGCKNNPAFIQNIIINPQPQAGYILPEVCLSDAFALFVDTSKVQNASITNWAWNFGDANALPVNNVSTFQNPQHRYSAIGSYTASLQVTSSNGCISSLSNSFFVNGAIPDADFGPASLSNYCANDSAAIKDNSTVDFGNITKVEIYWDNSGAPTVFETDDLPISGKIYKHKYPDFQTPLTKTFSIRYRAYSGGSCIDEITKPITVNASPKVLFTTIPEICLSAAPYQVIQATETGGVPGNALYSGNGITSNGLFTASVAGIGSTPIKYLFISNFGCRDSAVQSIPVLAPPVANFGISRPLCENLPVKFTDSSRATIGNIVSWLWKFGDGSADSLKTSAMPVLYAYSLANTYNATLTVVTNKGCSATSLPKPIAIKNNPLASFTYPANSCLPNAVVAFTNTSTILDGTESAFTYQWNFGEAGSPVNTSVAKNPSHTYPAIGPYNVKLSVTSGNQCVDDTIISIDRIRPEPRALFTSDSTSICANQKVQFKDLSDGGTGNINKWSWDFGDGQTFSPGKVPPRHTYTAPNTYQVTLQIENDFGCTNKSTPKPFVVYPNPTANAGTDKVVLEGGALTLDAAATGNRLKFSWLPPNYLNDATLLNPNVLGLDKDVTFVLTVIAEGGCKKRDDVSITVLKKPIVPNTFSPNNDGTHDNWTIQYLDSYPGCRIQVFNRYGQIVFDKTGYTPPGWDGIYQGKILPIGTYYYVIEPGSGRKPITGYVTILK